MLVGLAPLMAVAAEGSDAIIVDAEQVKGSSPQPDLVLSYTGTQGRDHDIYVFRPAQAASDTQYPAVVMYHGGGWKRGTPDQFYRHARVWNDLGLVVLLPVYGLEDTHGATPKQSVEDAFLAWQAIGEQAQALGINPDAIGAGGGSAGGHLAAALATLEPPASVTGHRPPAALVLFNPVIDNSPGGYGADRIGADWERFSPFHNIGQEHPPVLFMLGDSDELIPVDTAEAYCDRVRAQGSDCVLKVYPDAVHGWFNREGFIETLQESTRFLVDAFSLKPVSFLQGGTIDAFLLIQDGDGDYVPLAHDTAYVAPEDHKPMGPLLRYEGPIVEGQAFGMRAYFDERARFDLFAKTGRTLALRGARNNYLEMAEWGRDPLFVGQSLGFATPAIVTPEGAHVAADVKERSVTTSVSDTAARFTLGLRGWNVAGVELDATHTVMVETGADFIIHRLAVDGALPGDLVAGLVRHEAAEMRAGDVGSVNYLLTYGAQTDKQEGLGMAIVYAASAGKEPYNDDLSHLAVLAPEGEAASVEYWATADWALDPDFAADIDAFEMKVRDLARRANERWSHEQ
ncbi:DUF4861 family protein [Aquisalinus flavus]|nr:DUF4861 family protein [Aquisalinus flavus]MBD0425951.1 DUF4861 family protein [Aquisalinus flavus]